MIALDRLAEIRLMLEAANRRCVDRVVEHHVAIAALLLRAEDRYVCAAECAGGQLVGAPREAARAPLGVAVTATAEPAAARGP